MATKGAAPRGELKGEELEAALDDAFGTDEAVAEDPRMGIPEGWPMIHTLISRILADVGPVVKDQTADTGRAKYNFRGIDQVVNAVNAAFKRHRVYPTSKLVEFEVRDTLTTSQKATREATLRVVFRFTAPDGTFVETEVPGEALDTSDKGTPKAMSVALRIALLQMLLLPTDEPTTDHEYHTRDGVGSMSKSTAAMTQHTLTNASLNEIVLFAVPTILEHSAWDRPVDTADATTWGQATSLALAKRIAEAPDHNWLTDAKGLLEGAKLATLKTPNGTMLDLLRARWMELRDLYANTLNHVTAQVLNAAGLDELEIALGCGEAAVEAGTMRAEDMEKVRQVAADRMPKLPEHAPHPEAEENRDGEPLVADPEDYGFGATRDNAAFLTFKTRCINAPVAGLGEEPSIREDIVYREIAALLTGEGTNDPASNYGTDGFTLVDDAIKAAHRREQTIGDVARARLDNMLTNHRALAEQG